MAAVRYVERNPVKAGLVEHAQDYRWSSAASHCGVRSDALLSAEFPPSGVIEDWPAWLTKPEDEELVGRIRKETSTGRPCGDAAFLDKIESQLKRFVRPQKRGPKPEKISDLNASQTTSM